MKKIAALILTLTTGLALADLLPVLDWDVDVQDPTEYEIVVSQGEAITLAPRYLKNNSPLSISESAAVRLYYRLYGSPTSAVHYIEGAVDGTNDGTVNVTLTSEILIDTNQYTYWVSVVTNTMANLRARGILTILDGFGAEGTPPASVFAMTTQAATNIANNQIAIHNTNETAHPYIRGLITVAYNWATNAYAIASTAFGWGDHSVAGYVTGDVVRVESDTLESVVTRGASVSAGKDITFGTKVDDPVSRTLSVYSDTKTAIYAESESGKAIEAVASTDGASALYADSAVGTGIYTIGATGLVARTNYPEGDNYNPLAIFADGPVLMNSNLTVQGSIIGSGSGLTGITASQVGAVPTNDTAYLNSLTNLTGAGGITVTGTGRAREVSGSGLVATNDARYLAAITNAPTLQSVLNSGNGATNSVVVSNTIYALGVRDTGMDNAYMEIGGQYRTRIWGGECIIIGGLYSSGSTAESGGALGYAGNRWGEFFTVEANVRSNLCVGNNVVVSNRYFFGNGASLYASGSNLFFVVPDGSVTNPLTSNP
jgi:hypothetical protein